MKLLILLILFPILLSAQKYTAFARLEATDPEGSEVTWKIVAGDPAHYFVITPCTGVIKVDTLVYGTFTRQRTFTITFTATDETGLSSRTTRKITLYKNKPPAVETKL